MRRFFMAAATYAACAMFAQVCAWMGYLPLNLPLWWALGAAAINGAFYVTLRSGLNLRLRDPSMTQIQLVVSMFAAMVLIAQAHEARGTFLMLLPVPLLFGVLRLNLRQMVGVGAVGILGYVGTIASIALYRPELVRLDLELLNLIALTIVMTFVCLMCAYISNVRADLGRAVKTIHEQAHRDTLTGLFNRRDLVIKLEIEVARCERQGGRGISMCMVDLDHFKRINDSFGHLVGDEVLVQVGGRLLESTRATDYVARYGGEEFVVLLDAVSDEFALAAAERIRVGIENMRIQSLPQITFTVSIGIATLAVGEAISSFFERADNALYAAKASGRNRVHLDVGHDCSRQDATVFGAIA